MSSSNIAIDNEFKIEMHFIGNTPKLTFTKLEPKVLSDKEIEDICRQVDGKLPLN